MGTKGLPPATAEAYARRFHQRIILTEFSGSTQIWLVLDTELSARAENNLYRKWTFTSRCKVRLLGWWIKSVGHPIIFRKHQKWVGRKSFVGQSVQSGIIQSLQRGRLLVFFGKFHDKWNFENPSNINFSCPKCLLSIKYSECTLRF